MAILLCLIVWPRLLQESSVTRQFSFPLLIALGYGCIVTVVFAGDQMFANIPLIGSVVTLYLSTYAVTSRKSLVIGMVSSVVSFIISSYFGYIAFNEGQYRLSGLFENPNAIGFGGCFVLLIILSRYIQLPVVVRFGIGIGLLPIMILTGSRNALVGLVGCIMSQTWRNRKLFAGLGVAGIIIAGGLVYFERDVLRITSRSVFTRLTSRELIARGGAGRMEVAKYAFQIGLERGFVGIGFGQYREKYHARRFKARKADGKIRQLGTHNFYITLLTEWGAVGFFCFALVSYRLYRAVDHLEYEKDFVLGFLAISMLNSLGNDMVGMIHFWVMLGCCVQLIGLAEKEPHAIEMRQP